MKKACVLLCIGLLLICITSCGLLGGNQQVQSPIEEVMATYSITDLLA